MYYNVYAYIYIWYIALSGSHYLFTFVQYAQINLNEPELLFIGKG